MTLHQTTPEEGEVAAWREYKACPTQAGRDSLVSRYEKLVRSVVTSLNPPQHQYDDFLQVGFIALIKAIDRYNPDRGAKFSTYAVPTIAGEIRRYKRDKLRAVKDRMAHEASPAYYRAERCFTFAYGDPPQDDTQLARFLGCSVEAVRAARQAGFSIEAYSLDTITEDLEGDGLPQLERIADTLPDPYECVENLAVKIALERLPDKRLGTILKLRFYQGLSQKEVGQRLKISQMHVSRLEREAIQQLREYFGVKPVEPITSESRRKTSPGFTRNVHLKEFIEAVKATEQRYGKTLERPTVVLGRREQTYAEHPRWQPRCRQLDQG